MKYLIVLILILPSSLFGQGRFDSVSIEAIKVTDQIFMLKGAGGNIGVITGTDGILIIDNQFEELSEKIKAAIGRLDGHPLRFQINTHAHGDHTGGNVNFSKSGATIVAHNQVRYRMMQPYVGADGEEPPLPAEAWPVISFKDGISFHMNGQDIELSHFGAAHTDGDAIIFFRQANVFHMGDIFVRYGYPYIDLSLGGNVKGFVDFLDKSLKMMNDDSKIIPGHGELGSKEDVQAFRDRINTLYQETIKAIDAGTKLEDVGSLPIAKKYQSDWGDGKNFVYMIAENYIKSKK